MTSPPGPGSPRPSSGANVPLGDLARCYRLHRDEIDRALARVLTAGRFILGPEVAAFEEDFAEYCGARHAVGVASGTDAIALALRAVGVGPGDEVVTTPLTAAFTGLAIVAIGARPVFADVDPVTLTLDPAAAARSVTRRTKALLPVHLYGRPADIDALRPVADDAGAAIVEDASQAHGATLRGRKVGTLADAAAFSFYPSKNLGAFGDAGAVVASEAAVADAVRRLRDGGQEGRYNHVEPGVNSRLDEIQAAILRVRLRHLDADNDRRLRIAATYSAALAAGARATPPAPDVETRQVHHLYVVRSPERERLAAYLARHGVATAVHYPTPLHRQGAFAAYRPPRGCPEAELAAAEVLSVPIFPELTDAEVAVVAGALAGA